MRIGVLGAGQLGRMLALAGYPLDFEFTFVDPSPEACAASLGTHLCAAYEDEGALARLCESCDLVTYEFENVPASAAQYVAARRPLLPTVSALSVGQDRLSEKTLFGELGIPVPRYVAIDSLQALQDGAARIGFPCVLKTRRLGYDGKGQAMLRATADLDPAWARLGGQPLILESFVAFEREVSMLAVRSSVGELAFYPIVENVHRDGILRSARPRIADPLQAKAETYARRVVDKLGYAGVLAFEFFAIGSDLFANEIAPRVHNSGHWTIEGAACSQFENHLRAIAGLPLGDTRLVRPCAMLNFIGSAPPLAKLAAIPELHVHLYGKSAKPQRKVGHGTLTANSDAALEQALSQVRSIVEAAAS